tara:strand:- start:93 stop:473 length:381 start_codon:yes stop_codon:yes gene_type:complete
MEFNKKIQIALGQMFKDAKLEKVATPKKVELNAISDFEQAFEKTLDADTKVSTNLIDDLRKAEVEYNKIEENYKKVVKLGDDLQASAKDLGIELPKEILNKIKSAEAGTKEVSQYVSKIKSMYNIF